MNGETFFVFVEDIDEFFIEESDETWRPLMEARQLLNLPTADRLVWFDGVAAGYFSQLQWPNEKCNSANAYERERRTKQLLDMPPELFRVFALPLSSDRDAGWLKEFQPSTWHAVYTSPQGMYPAFVLPDFEIDAAADRLIASIMDFGGVGEELERLRESFSLNHIPDMSLFE